MKHVTAAILIFGAIGAMCHAAIWHGCALAPDGHDAWVVTIETTDVYHTADLGSHWQQQTILTNHDFFDVFFLDSLNGWTCGTIAEVQHTTDGGSSWNWQGFGASKFFTRIFFLDLTHGWAAAGAAIMGRWDEAAQTWQQIILPFPPFSADTCDFYGVSFVDTMRGWAVAGRYPSGDTLIGGQGYIAQTTDGGFVWSLQKRDTTNDYFDVEFLDSLNGWVVGGDDRTMGGYVARTTDGGVTWTAQNASSAGLLRAVDFVNTDEGWAVGKFGTVLHTTNSGADWLVQASGVDSTLFDVDFADNLTGIASGTDAIIVTTDGGNTWRSSRVGVAEPAGPRPGVRDIRSISAAPNPSRGSVLVSGSVLSDPSAQIEVYDATGRLLKPRSTAGPNASIHVDLAGLEPGVYVIQVSVGNRKVGQRIVRLDD